MTGTVREWHRDRAYGWIATARGLSCYFAHIADVCGRVEPREGQRVRFVPVRTDRGPRAVHVEVLEEGN